MPGQPPSQEEALVREDGGFSVSWSREHLAASDDVSTGINRNSFGARKSRLEAAFGLMSRPV